MQFFNSPIARWIAIESHKKKRFMCNSSILQFSHCKVNSHWITQKKRFIPYHDMELRKLEMSTSFKFFAIQAILLQLLEELLLVWKGVKESKIGCHNGARPSPFRYVSPGGMDYSRTFESQPWHSELGCAIFTFWFSWKCSKYYFVNGQRSHENKITLKKNS